MGHIVMLENIARMSNEVWVSVTLTLTRSEMLYNMFLTVQEKTTDWLVSLQT